MHSLLERIRQHSRRAAASLLKARKGYRLWASSYAAETATSVLDDELADETLHSFPRQRTRVRISFSPALHCQR